MHADCTHGDIILAHGTIRAYGKARVHLPQNAKVKTGVIECKPSMDLERGSDSNLLCVLCGLTFLFQMNEFIVATMKIGRTNVCILNNSCRKRRRPFDLYTKTEIAKLDRAI